MSKKIINLKATICVLFCFIFLIANNKIFAQIKTHKIFENDKIMAYIEYELSKKSYAKITKYYTNGNISEIGFYEIPIKVTNRGVEGFLKAYYDEKNGNLEWNDIFKHIKEGIPYYKFYQECSDSVFIYYYENGVKKAEGKTDGTRKLGKWINYYQNGNIKSEIEYDEYNNVLNKIEYKESGDLLGTPDMVGDTLVYERKDEYNRDEKYYVVWSSNFLKIVFKDGNYTEYRIVNPNNLKQLLESTKPIQRESGNEFPAELIVKNGKEKYGKVVTEYKDGKKHEEIWYDNRYVGGISMKIEYDKGIEKKLTQFYLNGNIWKEGNYDSPESYYLIEYYEEKKGLKKMEGKTENGFQEGKWLFYDLNGRVEEKEFKNGVEISK